MRELKFRGLRVDGNGLAIGFYRKNTFYNRLGDEPKEIYTKHLIGCFDNISYFDGIFEQVEVVLETIGQFTGLTDKNGVEIYEGDIVNFRANYTSKPCGYFNGVVEINPYNLIIRVGDLDYNASEEVEGIDYNCEVIGNIHQNKDLLT